MVVNTLREWKLACPKSEAGLVFPSSGGRVEHHKNIIERGLIPTLKAAGVTVKEKGVGGTEDERAKYTGLHAFRHFYASWCINRRAEGGLELPAKVVQERLGHSSIMMTMDVYGHLFPRGDDWPNWRRRSGRYSGERNLAVREPRLRTWAAGGGQEPSTSSEAGI